MQAVLPVVSLAIGIIFAVLSISPALSRYHSPALSRATALALAAGSFATAIAAASSVESGEQVSRLLYGGVGLTVSVMLGLTGLYAYALAPGAYDRQHPESPSVAASRFLELTGKAAALFLIALCVVGLIATLVLILSPP